MSEKAEAMTAERIAEIKAREGKATPGPWVDKLHVAQTADGLEFGRSYSVIAKDGGVCMLYKGDRYNGYYNQDADAAFIASARQDIPDLLAEVERLRAENKRLERQVMQLAEAEQMRAREALIETRLAKIWITSSQGGRHE